MDMRDHLRQPTLSFLVSQKEGDERAGFWRGEEGMTQNHSRDGALTEGGSKPRVHTGDVAGDYGSGESELESSRGFGCRVDLPVEFGHEYLLDTQRQSAK
jgi:hypothetical protein